MNSDPRALAALHWLGTLTDKQFAEFFYEAVRERNTSDQKEWNGHFVLADTERVTNFSWSLACIALPDPTAYAERWGDDAAICQSGTCMGCDTEVRSWAKHAICPICGTKVYLT